jgi:poly(3-hydroxyalkanoate) depolymerase
MVDLLRNSTDSSIVQTNIEIDGLSVHVAQKKMENRRDPPLLLFNGIGANVELLFPLMLALQGIECVAFDIPGIGGSETPLMPMRFKSLSRLSVKVLNYFDYDAVDVLGVSWGGGLAQEFAYRQSHICRRLILVATSPGAVMVPGHPRVFMKLSTPKRYLDPNYMNEVAQHIYGGQLRDNPALIREFSNKIKTQQSSRGYLYQLAAIVGWTSIHWLHKLTQPTLIISGTDDPLVPIVNAHILNARIPDSRLLKVDCGHLLLLTKTEEVAPKIVQFLRQKPLDQSALLLNKHVV